MTTQEYNLCVKELADRLYRFAWKSLGDEEEAKDAVQQAFLTLWEKRGEVLPDKAKAFLFTIAYRRSMDRHRKRVPVSLPGAMSELTTDKKQPYDLKQILQNALERLDRQSRTLILLKDYEGYRYGEIAQLTGLSETQVKVYLHRARKTLRTYLVSREYLI